MGEGEGGRVSGAGGSHAAVSPPWRFSDGQVIFTIRALRAALLISYTCPSEGRGRFWGRGEQAEPGGELLLCPVLINAVGFS